MLFGAVASVVLGLAASVTGIAIDAVSSSSASAAACPGYVASNVKTTGNSMTATLKLNGKACNVYGTDISPLTLLVEYQTSGLNT